LLNRNLLTDIKISFYRNIAILCAEMSRVNWALGKISFIGLALLVLALVGKS
jgi:hypothetical protein